MIFIMTLVLSLKNSKWVYMSNSSNPVPSTSTGQLTVGDAATAYRFDVDVKAEGDGESVSEEQVHLQLS